MDFVRKFFRRQKNMKKTLAVILSVVMIICCIPFSAGANSRVEITGTHEIKNSSWMVSDTDYVVTSGAVLVVPSGITAYVPSDCNLVISKIFVYSLDN